MDNSNASLRALRGPFDLILADPPWNFASNSQDKPGRNARRHYDCMSLEDICDLPVREIAAKDAILLLWTTVPYKEMAWKVIDAWGFKYKSERVWVKNSVGTGFWSRNRHENLLLCSRGSPPVRPFYPGTRQMMPAPFSDSVIEAPKRQHSRKPDSLFDEIAACEQWSDLAKLEMFARETRPGWTAWGNETTKFNSGDSEIDALLGEGFNSAERACSTGLHGDSEIEEMLG